MLLQHGADPSIRNSVSQSENNGLYLRELLGIRVATRKPIEVG